MPMLMLMLMLMMLMLFAKASFVRKATKQWSDLFACLGHISLQKARKFLHWKFLKSCLFDEIFENFGFKHILTFMILQIQPSSVISVILYFHEISSDLQAKANVPLQRSLLFSFCWHNIFFLSKTKKDREISEWHEISWGACWPSILRALVPCT